MEFHINCWKKFKAASFADKNDKVKGQDGYCFGTHANLNKKITLLFSLSLLQDFLQDTCFTPDCTGRICQFVIFGSTGLIKCKVGLFSRNTAVYCGACVARRAVFASVFSFASFSWSV